MNIWLILQYADSIPDLYLTVDRKLIPNYRLLLVPSFLNNTSHLNPYYDPHHESTPSSLGRKH